MEDANVAVPFARPVWSRTVLPNVLTAQLDDHSAPASERVDLRLLSALVTIAIGRDDTEHVLFSDGRRFLRIDIIVGALVGCPSSLTYLLSGLTRLAGPIAALDRLARLVRVGSFEGEKPPAAMRQHSWIRELRVADAVANGYDQQSIARTLFGSMMSENRWRVEHPSHRRQVQRLVAMTRLKLRDPFQVLCGRPGATRR